jgi:peptide subunit release factor 1 (eRF1)
MGKGIGFTCHTERRKTRRKKGEGYYGYRYYPPPKKKINMYVEQVDTAEPPQRPRITTRPRSKTVQEGAIVEMTCIAQVVNSRAQE